LQWGAFDAASTRLVAAPLAWFALGLVGYALAEVLTRAFYAMHDTVTPVAVGVATIALNIALGAALVGRYGAAGLAFGLSATTALEATVLLVALRGRLGGAGPGATRWLGRVLAAAGVMTVLTWLMAPRLAAATVPGSGPRVVQIALFAFALALALASYLFAAHLLRLSELAQGLAPLRGRLAPVERPFRRATRRRSGWRP
jgi:putative peptidoglycan lipid II flippase